MMIHSTVLQNGVRVVLADHPDTSVASAGVFVRQGSRNEEDHERGISHFLEHMVYNNQRAIQRGANSLQELLNKGGVLNAHTSKECTSYEGFTLAEYLELLIKALYETVFTAEFTNKDVDNERKIILAELRRKESSADQVISLLSECIFSDSGYGNSILGTDAFINSITAEELMEKYYSSYVADNVCLVILTNRDINYLMPIIQQTFGYLRSGTPTPFEVPLTQRVHMKLVPSNSNMITFSIGGIGPSLREPNVRKFELAIKTWGGIPNSRLFLSAREREGLVYQIQSYFYPYTQTGFWGVYCSVQKENFPRLISNLLSELEIMRTTELDDSELDRGISVLKTDLLTKLQGQMYFLKLLGRREIFDETVHPNGIVRQYEVTNPSDILALSNEYLRPNDLSFAALGNLDDKNVMEVLA